MATLHRVASLRIVSDELIPSEISALLGCEPTTGWARGDVVERGKLPPREARFGMWSLRVAETQPADLDTQVRELLARLTAEMDVWAHVCAAHHVSLFCGWFMQALNEGVSIAPSTLTSLGARGIGLDIDLYGGSDDDEQPVAPIRQARPAG